MRTAQWYGLRDDFEPPEEFSELVDAAEQNMYRILYGIDELMDLHSLWKQRWDAYGVDWTTMERWEDIEESERIEDETGKAVREWKIGGFPT